MRKTLLALLLVGPVLLAQGTSPAADSYAALIEGPQSGRDGELPSLALDALMQKLGVPGMSIAVIRDFDIHWSRGYGLADVTANTRVTPDTLFQAASISKPVAAMAVLKAVQDGRFGLDQDVNTILTSWKVPASERDGPPTRHAARSPEPHLGHRRWLRISRLQARCATTHAGADSRGRTAVQRRQGDRHASAVDVIQVFRRRRHAGAVADDRRDEAAVPRDDARHRAHAARHGSTAPTSNRCRPSAIATPPARTIAPARHATSSGTSIRSSPPRGCGRHRRIWRGSASRSRNRSRAGRIGC